MFVFGVYINFEAGLRLNLDQSSGLLPLTVIARVVSTTNMEFSLNCGPTWVELLWKTSCWRGSISSTLRSTKGTAILPERSCLQNRTALGAVTPDLSLGFKL